MIIDNAIQDCYSSRDYMLMQTLVYIKIDMFGKVNIKGNKESEEDSLRRTMIMMAEIKFFGRAYKMLSEEIGVGLATKIIYNISKRKDFREYIDKTKYFICTNLNKDIFPTEMDKIDYSIFKYIEQIYPSIYNKKEIILLAS